MKTLILLLLAASLAGCDGMNSVKVRQSVVEHFHSLDVALVPGKSYSFIVRDNNGDVWYAECMGADAKVTAKTQLFAAAKK